MCKNELLEEFIDKSILTIVNLHVVISINMNTIAKTKLPWQEYIFC